MADAIKQKKMEGKKEGERHKGWKWIKLSLFADEMIILAENLTEVKLLGLINEFGRIAGENFIFLYTHNK